MCNNKYGSPSALWKHRRTFHEKVKYECDQCNKSFDNQRKLSHHKQKGHKGIIFERKDCGEEFAYKHSLTRHLKQQHNGESASKKIKPNLDHQFQENSNRENHRDGFESFSCGMCGISVSSSKILEMHKVMVHP